MDIEEKNENKEEEKVVKVKRKGKGLFTLFACIMTGIIVFFATNLGNKVSKYIDSDKKSSNTESKISEKKDYKYVINTSLKDTKETATVVALDGENIAWEYKAGEYDQSELDTFTLYEGESYIYVAEAGNIKALNKKNGEVIWTSSSTIGRSTELLEVNDKVYVISKYVSNLFVIDVKTGKVEETIPFTYIHPVALKKESENIISFVAFNKTEDVTVQYDINAKKIISPKTTVETTKQEGFTDEELSEMAIKYYKSVTKDVPNNLAVSVDGSKGEVVTIHLFEDGEFNNATIDWYTVNRKTGKGKNFTNKEIDITKISEPVKQDGYTDDELISMAAKYYKANTKNAVEKVLVVIDSSDDDEVLIHLLENGSENTATINWYTINRKTGKGTDLFDKPVDLTK